MTPETPTDPAPSAAEVKERLKELNEIVGDYDFRMSYGTEHGQTIASAIALIEQGEKERERSLKYRCDACGGELSACGEQNPDGTPSDDCLVCRLRDSLAAATERLKLLSAEIDGYQSRIANKEVYEQDLREKLASARKALQTSLPLDVVGARRRDYDVVVCERDSARRELAEIRALVGSGEPLVAIVEARIDAARAQPTPESK